VPNTKTMLIAFVRCTTYTDVWNILDYTAVAIPVTSASKAFDSFPAEPYQPLNETDSLYDPNSIEQPMGL
jgi:hypothetical protein